MRKPPPMKWQSSYKCSLKLTLLSGKNLRTLNRLFTQNEIRLGMFDGESPDPKILLSEGWLFPYFKKYDSFFPVFIDQHKAIIHAGVKKGTLGVNAIDMARVVIELLYSQGVKSIVTSIDKSRREVQSYAYSVGFRRVKDLHEHDIIAYIHEKNDIYGDVSKSSGADFRARLIPRSCAWIR